MCAIIICKAIRLPHVNERSHSFTCHPHVYPRMEWAILSLLPSRRTSRHFGWYSFPVPLRVGGWVGLGGSVKYWGGLKKVTHPRRPKIELETSTRLPSHRWIADCTFLKVIAVSLLLFVFQRHFWATVTTVRPMVSDSCPVLSDLYVLSVWCIVAKRLDGSKCRFVRR